jgi:hypothetical protein
VLEEGRSERRCDHARVAQPDEITVLEATREIYGG